MQQKHFTNPNNNRHQDKEKVKSIGIIIYQAQVDSLLSRLAASDYFVVQSNHHIPDNVTVADFKWVLKSKK
jgi:ABC-type cobalamin transport system ATPase subunit